ASIIISHQHPSQDPFQSQEDINVTKRVYEAGKIIGIELLDSLIVVGGSDKFTSMKEKGYLN
ncbi:JAB domain-containing protein, partial [Virgibacillus salexigens]